VTAPAIELCGVSKRYGPVVAADAVDLAIDAGSIHAVVGENGAGKSTLMKLAYGQVSCDAGQVRLKGKDVSAAGHSPARSIGAGVGMVHQHFALVGPFSVVENLVLGREPVKRGLVDLERAAAELRELATRFGFDVDPWARCEDLSVGEQQRVEILKVLWQGCDVLILDEPTAVLTPAEVRELFAVLRSLVADGATVVIVTHKLDEVVAIADAVTVMRRGQVVERMAGELSVEAIARAMVGRPVLLEVARAPAEPGDDVLEVDSLVVRGSAGRAAVNEVSFSVRAGEVFGIAGVEGNGQTELLEALVGLRPVARGAVKLVGTDITDAPVALRNDCGLAHVAEDRHARGLVLSMSIAENLAVGRQRELSAGRFLPRMNGAAIGDLAGRSIEDFDIRPGDADATVAGLSGGNQQKVVVAREITRPGLSLLVCAQPTRGVDIGAIELIHRRIVAARDAGAAVLLVSAELSEIRSLSDRVAVLYRGRIAEVFDGAALAEGDALERLGQLMTGAVS